MEYVNYCLTSTSRYLAGTDSAGWCVYFEEAADKGVSDSKRAGCMVSVCNKQSVSLREWEDKRRRQTARAADINRLREREKKKKRAETKEALRQEKRAV